MFSKKTCSIVLAIMMLLSVLSLPVLAETSQSNMFEIIYRQGEGYTITFDVEGEKSEVNGVVTYKFPEGTGVTATIKVSSGYKLISIKANGITLPDAPGKTEYALTVDVDTSIAVTVEKLPTSVVEVIDPQNFTYKLEGVDSENKAVIGSQVTLTVTPDEGFKVSKIYYNGEQVTTANTYTFTVGQTNKLLVVVDEDNGPEQKRLIIENIANGTVTANADTFDVGSSVTLTLTPAAGYMLSSLKLNGIDIPLSNITNNKYTFTISVDTVVNAVFVKSLTITVQLGKGGTLSINGKEVTSSLKVAEGSDVMVSVSPSLGYTIDSVKVDGADVALENNSFTISAINANKRITVTFKAAAGIKQYTITASAGTGGTITPANVTVVDEGKNITYVVTPEAGKEVDTVLVDGQPVSLTNNTYTFTNVAASHTITVTFKDASTPITPTPTGIIGVADVNWNADTIVIDITTKTLVSAEVFQKITNEFKDKTVVFAAEKYKWTLPKGASISITAAYADVAIQTNNSLYAEAANAVSRKMENAKLMLYSYANGVLFPAGTTLEVMLPNSFVSQDVQQLVYDASAKSLSNPKNELGDSAFKVLTVSSDCWVKMNYNNESNIVLSDVLSKYYTINVISNVGGKITPSDKVLVEEGGTIRFRVTADTGYVISSLAVGPTEDTDAQGKEAYDKLITQVTENKTITVSFKLADTTVSEGGSSSSSSLVVALIIIALAAAGGATLFIIKLRQERY